MDSTYKLNPPPKTQNGSGFCKETIIRKKLCGPYITKRLCIALLRHTSSYRCHVNLINEAFCFCHMNPYCEVTVLGFILPDFSNPLTNFLIFANKNTLVELSQTCRPSNGYESKSDSKEVNAFSRFFLWQFVRCMRIFDRKLNVD